MEVHINHRTRGSCHLLLNHCKGPQIPFMFHGHSSRGMLWCLMLVKLDETMLTENYQKE